MGRIIKEYEKRLNELLDAAQHLFFVQGYEKTSVNDIIEKIGVAKGTFYHYFKSKKDLLDKLTFRFTEKLIGQTRAVVEEKNTNAIDKINHFFLIIRDIKFESLELMKMLMKVLYTDENTVLRHNMLKHGVELAAPILAELIRQGKEEGSLDPLDPDESAEIIFRVATSLNETVVQLLLEAEQKPENLDLIEEKMITWERCIERILGAESGTLTFVERRFIDMARPGAGDKTEEG